LKQQQQQQQQLQLLATAGAEEQWLVSDTAGNAAFDQFTW
jgi:hypothetical protein